MVQKSILENGIQVITELVPHSRSLAMGILVDAGPQNEKPEKAGTAHFTEHMMFQGTSTRNALEIARLMDMTGGSVGAFTGRDYTCYYATVLDDNRTYVLDLFGDILLNSTFPQERVSSERQAILSEIELESDDPEARAQNILKSYVWRNHPLGRPVPGTVESVKTLSREDIIYFVFENYLPNKITIAAAGNVQHDDFTAQVRDCFWRMMGSGTPLLLETPEFHGGLTLEHTPSRQAYFSLALPAPPYPAPERYNLHLLNTVLGGGISSRLFRRLREKEGLVYQIGSDIQCYRDAGALLIEGSTAPEELERVFKAILDELRLLTSGEKPITEEELWKAKTQIKGCHLLDSEDVSTRLSRLLTQDFYFGRHISSHNILQQIEKIDLASLGHITLGYLKESLPHLACAMVGPLGSDQRQQEHLKSFLEKSKSDLFAASV